MTPDRISEFSRGERQQEVFYNTQAWQSSLGGKGALSPLRGPFRGMGDSDPFATTQG